jgi:hypothetical protein
MLQKLSKFDSNVFAGKFVSQYGKQLDNIAVGKNKTIVFDKDFEQFTPVFMADLAAAYKACGFEPAPARLEKEGVNTFSVKDKRGIDRGDNPVCRFVITPDGTVVFDDTHWYLTKLFVSGLITAYQECGFQV